MFTDAGHKSKLRRNLVRSGNKTVKQEVGRVRAKNVGCSPNLHCAQDGPDVIEIGRIELRGGILDMSHWCSPIKAAGSVWAGEVWEIVYCSEDGLNRTL